MYLTKDEFLQKFGILPQEFEEADISWEELLEIADDYERRRPTLEKIRKEFVAEFLQDKEKEIGLQSYHSRLKDTEHLVEKLVRKRLENYAKYRKMDSTSYMRYVTDLIGIRGLLLYREDWVNFHKYITHWFKNDPEKYIRDYGRDYDQNASGYMAEPPKVHTRLGDYADIYVNWIPEENILNGNITVRCITLSFTAASTLKFRLRRCSRRAGERLTTAFFTRGARETPC